ncbi:hypothetical protein ACTPDI_18180 [Clostridioides difficile]
MKWIGFIRRIFQNPCKYKLELHFYNKYIQIIVSYYASKVIEKIVDVKVNKSKYNKYKTIEDYLEYFNDELKNRFMF